LVKIKNGTKLIDSSQGCVVQEKESIIQYTFLCTI